MKVHTTLIDAPALAALARESVLIVDCRFDLADPQAAEQAYRTGHIPGAVYANLDRDLSDLVSPPKGLGRHPLPSPAALSALLSRWGWRPDIQIVAYDAAGGALAAARLWWLLRLCGVHSVAVLDGGYAAWTAAGLALNTDIPVRAPTAVHLQYDDEATVHPDELASRLEAGRVFLMDARAAPRFRGDVEPLDPVAGHVPGAHNRPFSENLDATGRFKSADELRAEFSDLIGSYEPGEVVHMCGSGVTACHNLLAMEHAGLSGSRLFAPSWSGWVSDPSRPVASGG
jgi:thiosulfate/3-mercaptopyruvate sulfurtransferase